MPRWKGLWSGVGLAVLVGAAALPTLANSALAKSADSPFDAEMAAAMDHMHHAMMRQPTGDPDSDFAAMMIAHHQGAIDMAKIELLYGKDHRLRRLAQGIVVEQTQEIAVMQQTLDDRTHPASPAKIPHGDKQ